jgi:uncharacterized lipoprotein
MNKLSLILLTVVSLQFGGCALTTDRIDISYNPKANIAVVEGAENIKVKIVHEDKRTVYKDRVGVKKNGYGMEMAAIVPTKDVAQTFADAIASEIESLGFKIGEGGKTLKVELVRFYNDFKMGFFAGDAVADGLINVSVANGAGELIFSRSYEGGAIEKNIQLAIGENARLALTKAMTDIVTKVPQDQDLQSALLK